MSKEDKIQRYADRHEARLVAMTYAQQLEELRGLRKGLREARRAYLLAKDEVEHSEAYVRMQNAKATMGVSEVAIEGTLRVLDTCQDELPMPAAVAGTMPLVNTETGEIVSEVRRR